MASVSRKQLAIASMEKERSKEAKIASKALALTAQGEVHITGADKSGGVTVEVVAKTKEQIVLDLLSTIRTYLTMAAGGNQPALNAIKCNNAVADLDQYLRAVIHDQDKKDFVDTETMNALEKDVEVLRGHLRMIQSLTLFEMIGFWWESRKLRKKGGENK